MLANFIVALILSCFTYILAKFAFIKLFKAKDYAKKYSIYTTLILFPIYYLCWRNMFISVMFTSLMLAEFHFDRNFDTEKWRENTDLRFTMRDDIERSKTLENISADDATKLLGIPDNVFDQDSVVKWKYPLGSHIHGFGIKFYYLELDIKNDSIEAYEFLEIID